MRALRRFTVRARLPEPITALGELVLNLRWSWHYPTMELFATVDPDLWRECRRDPVKLLGAVSSERLAELAADTGFIDRLRTMSDELHRYLDQPRWYQTLRNVPRCIAYFSPEFGITEVLPQYSGGLGILAGDHLKSASDLGVPIMGVGLLYRAGYFQQSLSHEGWQEERYPPIDPHGLPLTQLTEADGRPTVVSVQFPDDRTLHAHVWKAQVGRVPLLLLDSDVKNNAEEERQVTDRLYGGATEHRLRQELLLGVGGVRAVRAFCRLTGHPEPEVFHTNEGHAGFLGVERIREHTENGLSFDEAMVAVRSGTVFTTHTPVPAGIDRFPRDMVARFLGPGGACAGVPIDRILELGAEGDASVFNMAHMGLRLAQRSNGVSKLHGQVSRAMFCGLWPGFDVDEVPIGHVTNGVHAPTWVARDVSDLAVRQVGAELVEQARGWSEVEQIDPRMIWDMRRNLRERLVFEVRRRLRESWLHRGATEAELGWIDGVFDADTLTVGFARRVPAYKRLTLMLRNPDRLRALLLDPERPMQVVVAGKSHPADDGGKALVQQMVRFADDPAVRHRIVFLPDYDIGMAKYLYWGCDVWLNNPLRPLEACGTSGMKAALNGGLNVSIRDGWWDEMFDGDNGWAIPTADGVPDPGRRDDLEAGALYEMLDHDVKGRFYGTDGDGIPDRWVDMVRHTLETLGPKVLASRMVRDYARSLYTPAAASAARLAADGYAGARELAVWQEKVRKGWPGVRVLHVESSGVADAPELGSTLHLRAEVDLDGLDPADVDVQAVYGRVSDTDTLHETSSRSMKSSAANGGQLRYEVDIPLHRAGAFGYTVRVLPRHALLSNPAELGLVTFA